MLATVTELALPGRGRPSDSATVELGTTRLAWIGIPGVFWYAAEIWKSQTSG